MISKLFKKNTKNTDVQKDLEDLFSRPIKAIEIEKEPEQPTNEELEAMQQEDEKLSALQLKVERVFCFIESIRKEMKELFS